MCTCVDDLDHVCVLCEELIHGSCVQVDEGSAHEVCVKYDRWAHWKYTPASWARMCKDLDRKKEKSFWFDLQYMVYVGLYSTTQQYGGPEEGGWWYDEHCTQLTVYTHVCDVEKTVKAMELLKETFCYQDSKIVISGSLPETWSDSPAHYE